MGLFEQGAKVRLAEARMVAARAGVAAPASALLVRGKQHPLTTVSAAAGAGFVLGRLNLHPLRIPGLGALLSGGMAEMVAMGARLIAEMGAGADLRQP